MRKTLRKTTCEDLNQRIKGEANSQLLPAMAVESMVAKINLTFIYISLLNSSASAPSFSVSSLCLSLSLSLSFELLHSFFFLAKSEGLFQKAWSRAMAVSFSFYFWCDCVHLFFFSNSVVHDLTSGVVGIFSFYIFLALYLWIIQYVMLC